MVLDLCLPGLPHGSLVREEVRASQRGVEVSGPEADERCVSARGHRLHPPARLFSAAFQVEALVRNGSPLPFSSDCPLGREVGGAVGDEEGEGDHHSEEDLFSLVCHVRIEGHHGERDEVEVGSGRTVEGS